MSWDEYSQAVVRIESPDGCLEVHPAPFTRHVGRFPTGCRAIYVVTAYNPRGENQAAAANDVAQANLLAEADRRGLRFWPAAGGDTSWQHVETSVALVDASEETALELARLFTQEAVFGWTADGWQIIAADGSLRKLMGWVVTVREEVSPAAGDVSVAERVDHSRSPGIPPSPPGTGAGRGSPAFRRLSTVERERRERSYFAELGTRTGVLTEVSFRQPSSRGDDRRCRLE